MRSHGSEALPPLAEAVRAQRAALGLTQADVASLAGVGLAFLYELEHGKPTVRMDKVVAVLKVLGLELRIAAGQRGMAREDNGT